MSSVRVDFSTVCGSVRPLQGLNGGPVCHGGLIDVSHYYRDLSVPHVRLHDPNWPCPREVDIPQVFPDFNADPEDPASYDFGRTDQYIREILNTGAKIVYRLGTSIEHTERKYYTYPPSDFDKWSRICIGVIKHYTQGWADGMYEAVDYWEIWNEPEIGDSMWVGSFEQYLELYRTASLAIKAFNPDLKVGGFAAAYPCGELSKVDQFLEYCRVHDLPLDFFSWHTYSHYPERYAESAKIVSDALDKHGFSSTESHLNEWNYMPANCGPIFEPGCEYERREAFEEQKNETGASFVAASLILFQDQRLDVANYYIGTPTAMYSGIFDRYGVPQKAYFAFKAFRRLLDYPDRVETETISADDNLYSLAAKDTATGRAAVLISRFDGATDVCTVEFIGMSAGKEMNCEVQMLDRDRNLESVLECRLDPAINIRLRKHSVALIKLS